MQRTLEVAAVSFLLFTVTLLAQPDSSLRALLNQQLSLEEAQQYCRMLRSLDPKLADKDIFRQLQDTYGSSTNYTMQQLLLAVDPTSLDGKTNAPYQPEQIHRSLPVPRGAFAAETIRPYFAVVHKREEIANYIKWTNLPDKEKAANPPEPAKDRMAMLIAKYGVQPWYRADEILDAEKNDMKRLRPVATVEPPRRESMWSPIWRGLHTVKIRKDWTDVTVAEDLSQSDTPKKSIDDLVGATFSYSDDGKANTWSTVGSIIVPFTWNGPALGGHLATFMLAPSVSLNRVSTSGDPKNEVNHLDYRLGTYWKWLGGSEGLSALQTRLAFVYGTDAAHRASLPAVEFDLEPQLLFNTL